jgi:hypothetical protein
MYFATPPNVVDVLILVVLTMLVPLLTSAYLNGQGWSSGFRTRVAVFGILWVCFGLVSEDLLEAAGLFERMDSRTHAALGKQLAMGLLPRFWETLPTGNMAYGAYLSAIFSLGADVPGARALNSFLGFWGGLALAKNFGPFLVLERRREAMVAAVIFLPSTVFWTSNNLKEGLTYWGVSLVFCSALSSGSQQIKPLLAAAIGTVVTGFTRPHVCLAALISLATVTFLRKRRIVFALLALAVVPMLFLKMQQLAHNELTSVESAQKFLEGQRQGLMGTGGGSTHRWNPGIPVVSGILNIFFRPFPWEAHSLFMAVCAIEIWSLTATIIWSWWRLTGRERLVVLKIPAVQSSLLFLALMSVLFSYLPNDGLLARQRVQIIPALMIVAIIPFGAESGLRRNGVTSRVPRRFSVPDRRLPSGSMQSLPPRNSSDCLPQK